MDEEIKKKDLRCTDCGGNTVFWGFARPRGIIINGERHKIPIRRVRCKHCSATHVIMPDFIPCGKHYSIFDIELAITDMENGLSPENIDSPADTSTIRRWHKSFREKTHRVAAGLMAILEKHFDKVVNNISTASEPALSRMEKILNSFPEFSSSNFLFSRANLIFSNMRHTHTLHGMTDTPLVKMWLSP